MPNAPVREMCGVKKEMDEWIDENALQRYGYMERKGNNKIAKRDIRWGVYWLTAIKVE